MIINSAIWRLKLRKSDGWPMRGKSVWKKHPRQQRGRKTKLIADNRKAPIVVEVILKIVQVQVALRIIPVEVSEVAVAGMVPKFV